MIDHHEYIAPSAEYASILSDGDRRSSDRVALMIQDADSFASLWALLADPNPVIRLRAADAADKATRAHPELLATVRADLLGPDDHDRLGEVAPFAARLALTGEEASRLMRRLEDCVLNSPST